LRHGQSYLERTPRGKVPEHLLASFFVAEQTRITELGEGFTRVVKAHDI
jgi:hypothetical protein